jgi:hypothetical protein
MKRAQLLMRVILKTVFLLAVLACAFRMGAQTSTGSVYGKVSDPQGLAVVGASVTVRSTDLTSARVTKTDATGSFAFAGLVPGAYTVEAEKKPLRLRRPVRLTISLGSSTQLAIKLDVAQVKQSTTVTAGGRTAEGNTLAPPINTTEASVSTFLAGQTVTYLPLRDRDISQFDQLATNTHEDADDTGVSVDGQRGDALITQLDDVAMNSPLLGGVRGAEQHGFLVPQTAVREFQIVSSGVGAEVGNTSAGLINIATKEGTNKYRGEQFYTARPATLSSADAFGHSLDNFQSVFGGSFGGPVRKDHSFFYVGYEQNFLHLPTYFAFAPQAAGVTVPMILSAQQTEIDERDTPIAVSGRYDQIVNARNTLNVEVVANRIRLKNQGDGSSRTLANPAFASSVSGQSFFTRAGLTTILTPRTVNQAVFSWSEDHRGQTPNSTASELFINGFGVLGGDANGPRLYTSQAYQMIDSVSIVRGKRLFAVGGHFDVDPAYEQREANLYGRFDYNSLTNYLNNQPRRFQQTFVIGAPPRYSGDEREAGVYATAHVELRDKLTLTAGLLWAGEWNPQPTHPNAAIAQTQRVPNDLTGWQPRLGFAWSPLKKTVVRASAGLYTATTPATFFHRTFADSGTQTVVADSSFDPQLLAVVGALGFPHGLAVAPPGLTTPEAYVAGVSSSFRNPHSLQGSFSVDQTVSPKLTLRAGYLHEETWRLEQRLDDNLAAPTGVVAGLPVFAAARPLAGVGRLMVEHSSAHSTYSGLSLTAISQVTRRSSLTANYTVSQTHDDASGSGPYGIDSALSPYNLRLERGYSSLDLRSTLNVSAIFNLPYGLKVNPLLLAHSGAPYTALVGFDQQNDANDWNDRAVVNGVVTARNQFRQPAFVDTDLRLVKDFTLPGEGHHLDLFMDVFNVVGTSNFNFGPEQISLYGSASSPVYSAGQALYAPGSSQPGGPRTFQFTARLVGF